MQGRSGTGFRVSGSGVADQAELFSEVPGRAIACTHRPDDLLELARASGVPARVLGLAGGSRAVVEGLFDLPLDDLFDSWKSALPRALDEPFEAIGAPR